MRLLIIFGSGEMKEKTIKFNIPPLTGKELNYIAKALENGKQCGDGEYTRKCNAWLEKNLNVQKALLTTSCTHALELAAHLIDVKPGDEVIMPSYTFVSTANAFALRGAKIVFVDVRPDTMNIDEGKIESAITHKTKVIVVVHYAGIACEMDKICEIASKHGLYVVEDAAQGILSSYKGRKLGSIGDFGCISFHETKNISMGEGGALLIKNAKYNDQAEIIREKGTDRTRFIRGEIDKYSWVSIGSSYLPSEINASFLYAQLEEASKINQDRLKTWDYYYGMLKNAKKTFDIQLGTIPSNCEQNGHMFYIKMKDLIHRNLLMRGLKGKGISTAFHYIPLHSSQAGSILGRFHGEDKYTTLESSRLLRLPMYYGLKKDTIEYICESILKELEGIK